jgi:hypothetical protein
LYKSGKRLIYSSITLKSFNSFQYKIKMYYYIESCFASIIVAFYCIFQGKHSIIEMKHVINECMMMFAISDFI